MFKGLKLWIVIFDRLHMHKHSYNTWCLIGRMAHTCAFIQYMDQDLVCFSMHEFSEHSKESTESTLIRTYRIYTYTNLQNLYLIYGSTESTLVRIYGIYAYMNLRNPRLIYELPTTMISKSLAMQQMITSLSSPFCKSMHHWGWIALGPNRYTHSTFSSSGL